jgi:hypothetical protein
MINRLLYTLYLISRKRKLSTHYLNAGGSVFFILVLNVLAIWMIISIFAQQDFFTQFVKNEWIVLPLVLLFFFGMQFYVYLLIKKYKTNSFLLQRMNPGIVFLYFLCTIVLFFGSFIITALLR